MTRPCRRRRRSPASSSACNPRRNGRIATDTDPVQTDRCAVSPGATAHAATHRAGASASPSGAVAEAAPSSRRNWNSRPPAALQREDAKERQSHSRRGRGKGKMKEGWRTGTADQPQQKHARTTGKQQPRTVPVRKERTSTIVDLFHNHRPCSFFLPNQISHLSPPPFPSFARLLHALTLKQPERMPAFRHNRTRKQKNKFNTKFGLTRPQPHALHLSPQAQIKWQPG